MMSNSKVLWCDANTLAKDISGKVYIVTGANSGVGLATTRQLVKQGGHVVMACRRPEAAKEAMTSFAGLKGSAEVITCDLADLQSVRNFVHQFKNQHSQLDGLMCNAGLVMMDNTPQYTADGFEMTWACSFFGHFLLTELLLDTLKASAPSRIGLLSSVMHAGSAKNRYKIHLNDLDYRQRDFNNFDAYGEVKLAVVLYAKELAERLEGTGVTTASIHPGWARSNFGGNGLLMKVVRVVMLPFQSMITNSNEESAQTSLHCLLSEDAPKHSGAYFSQHSVLYRDKQCRAGGWPMASPNPHANNVQMAKQLVRTARERVDLPQA